MAYAERTEVPVERSQAALQKLITRYGARKFGSMVDEDAGVAVVTFESHGRRVLFRLQIPEIEQFEYDPAGRSRSPNAQRRAWEQEQRRLWRALLLVITAKLASIESGIETFDEAFLPQLVLPTGGTVGEWIAPQLDEAYERNALPPMLPGVGGDQYRMLEG